MKISEKETKNKSNSKINRYTHEPRFKIITTLLLQLIYTRVKETTVNNIIVYIFTK